MLHHTSIERVGGVGRVCVRCAGGLWLYMLLYVRWRAPPPCSCLLLPPATSGLPESLAAVGQASDTCCCKSNTNDGNSHAEALMPEGRL